MKRIKLVSIEWVHCLTSWSHKHGRLFYWRTTYLGSGDLTLPLYKREGLAKKIDLLVLDITRCCYQGSLEESRGLCISPTEAGIKPH